MAHVVGVRRRAHRPVGISAQWVELAGSRRVDLSVGALQSYDGARFFSKGTVLEVTILNPSSRIANLVRAEVRFRGRRLARRAVRGADVNALSPVNRRDLVSASLHLPVSIPPGQAVIVGLVTTPRDIDVVNQLARAANPAYGTNPGARAAPFSLVPHGRVPQRQAGNARAASVATAETGRRAGGSHAIRARWAPDREDGCDAEPRGHVCTGRQPRRRPRLAHRLDVAARHVQGLVVFKPMHHRPENARIKLWRGNGRRPQQTKIEPLYGDTACIDFGALHAYRYRWSAEVRGRRIAAGRFRTPCTPVSDHPASVSPWIPRSASEPQLSLSQ